MYQPRPFRIEVEQRILDRIATRLDDYEWPPLPAGAGWQAGAEAGTMRHLVQHWRENFQWRRAEAQLNEHPQYLADTGTGTLHYVHHRPASAAGTKPAIVLLHGWPSSYMEYLDTAQALARHGFPAIVVSLPGCGFSGIPSTFIGPRAIARQVHTLLAETIGISRYVAHGSDWGSLIAGWIGFDFPQACAGVHMTMVSPRFVAGAASEPHEQQWLAGFRERFEEDGAYFRLQTSRPVTAGFALHDSPVGWLAWTAEKFAAWGDPAECGRGELFRTTDQADWLIRNSMLYLATGTVASSMWIYRGLAGEGPPGYPDRKRVEVPVAIAATRDPVFVAPPRSLVEKAYNVTRWTEYARGGHFPALDAPALLQSDLGGFAGSL